MNDEWQDALITAKLAMQAIERHEKDCMEHRKHQDETRREVLDELKAIRSTLDQAKGGWKMLVTVGGVAGAIGSVGTWALTHLMLGN